MRRTRGARMSAKVMERIARRFAYKKNSSTFKSAAVFFVSEAARPKLFLYC
jgi:hypothetical protein